MGDIRLQSIPQHTYKMAAFNGSWACSSTDGFDGFLKELGVGMIKRKVACGMKPTLVIQVAGDGSSFSFNNGKDNKTIPFGKAYDDEVGGAPGTSNFKLDSASKMSNKFEFKKNPGKFVSITREVNGDSMVQTMDFNGKV